MKNTFFFLLMVVGLFCSCKKDSATPSPDPTPAINYFPPVGSAEWQTTTVVSLGWNELLLNDLYSYLQSKGTRAFIILKNGKIVSERYFGSFTVDSNWYWASAGKTMTGLLAGIAQQEGLLTINNKTSQYLGTGWTSLPLIKDADARVI